MISKLLRFALQQPFITIVLSIALIGLGIYSFRQLKIEAYPDISDTQVTVITTFPGQAAEEMELQVTVPIERALNSTPNIIARRSRTIYGLSVVELTFAYGTNDYFARQVELATRHGVEKILLDPGLGFYYRNLQDSAARVRHQMTVFLNSFRLRTLGFPICHALPHAFEYFGEEVRCAEPYFAVLAALGQTDLFRTHEAPRVKAVLETMRVF